MSILGTVGSLLTGGGFDAIGGAAAGYMNYRAAQATNEMNYKIFREQLDYDKPVNQVARLKEAGLNPNLVYGSGIQNMQTAGKQPRMENPMEKALNSLNMGLMSAQLRKSNAEAVEARENAKIAKANAQYAPVMNTFSMLNAHEGYLRSILNNERLRFDNNLLFQGYSPSFDRGVWSQGGRLLSNLFHEFVRGRTEGVTNSSRPRYGHGFEESTDGSYASRLSPAAFSPVGSFGYGISYF